MTRSKCDIELAVQFIESLPVGHWTTFKDAAAAGGNPSSAQALGNWLRNHGHTVSGIHRVLDRNGKFSDGWTSSGPESPASADVARQWLESEGVAFPGGHADPACRVRHPDA